MKHIIVPIDFSNESINGLRLAIIFANHFKSTIQLVYVQKTPTELGRADFNEEKKTATANLNKIVEEYRSKLIEPAKIEYIVKKGKVYKEIVNQAQAFDESMIISSTHGASGFEEFFIGSNTFKIISASDLPVLTIRHGAVAREIKKIVLPIDVSADTRQKVPFTVEIAKAFNAEIHVLGVTSTKNAEIDAKITAYTNQVCEYLKDHEIKYNLALLNGSNITDVTIEYALDNNADLISIMTEQNEPIASFVLGSYAQQMLSKSPIPVMSITPKEIFIMGSFRTFGAPY
ncbi:MAG TPA: universal stress protein [Tenuifilaceae bacterium]|nr:universal stress protein [Tenuifilaceae bacterium]HPJ47126.1 universal stress protein [Tenuifilaceae bacterium]HPQ35673.1 universal stress protein [Tenuifilaceae bacterium]